MTQPGTTGNGSWMTRQNGPNFAIIVATVCTIVYANTLLAAFSFDDNFALLSNADVLNDEVPLKDLLKHDFWGQDIRSAHSHKSYRPLTVLVYRYCRKLSNRLWLYIAEHVKATGIYALFLEHNSSGLIHPLPFHFVNVMGHALVAVLVYREAAVCLT